MGSETVERDRFDQLDCFNEDLVWIVDRLVTRSGGRFGLITRHVQGEGPMVLAQTTEMPAAAHSLVARLTTEASAAISAAISAERRRHDDCVDLRESHWTPDHQESSPGSFRLLQLTFSPTQNVSIVASICRPDGTIPYDQLERATASRLHPVLSRYVRLWWLHRLERRRANSLGAALDLSDVGVMLLDRRSHLLFANTHAMAILEQRDGLRRSGDSITATEASVAVRFQAAIQQALHWNQDFTATSQVAHAAPILLLHRATERRALVATVMSVRHAAIDLRDAAVIIYVFDPERDFARVLAPICRIYKLTGAEAHLVHHLMSGLRITEAAKRMQVQPDTARAYLKQVFLKTATNRQVDLMRLMFTSMLRTNATIDLALLSAF